MFCVSEIFLAEGYVWHIHGQAAVFYELFQLLARLSVEAAQDFHICRLCVRDVQRFGHFKRGFTRFYGVDHVFFDALNVAGGKSGCRRSGRRAVARASRRIASAFQHVNLRAPNGGAHARAYKLHTFGGAARALIKLARQIFHGKKLRVFFGKFANRAIYVIALWLTEHARNALFEQLFCNAFHVISVHDAHAF